MSIQKNTEKLVPMTVWFSEAQKKRLKAEAKKGKKDGLTCSKIIREAVTKHLK